MHLVAESCASESGNTNCFLVVGDIRHLNGSRWQQRTYSTSQTIHRKEGFLQWISGVCFGKPTGHLEDNYPTEYQTLPNVSSTLFSVSSWTTPPCHRIVDDLRWCSACWFQRTCVYIVPSGRVDWCLNPIVWLLVPPKNGMISSASSHAISSAFWSGTGTEYAIGHLVRKSWNTTMCLFPCWVLHNINPNSFLGQYLECLGHFGEPWNESSVIQAHSKERTYFLRIVRDRKFLDCCHKSWVGVEALWSCVEPQILHLPSDEMAFSRLKLQTSFH